MSLTLFLAFVGTETILCLTPGPAVTLIISQGLTGSARASAWGTAGILTVNAIYFTLSALGVGALLLASTAVFAIVKWCGVAYLVAIGLSMLFGKATVDVEVKVSAQAQRGQFLQGAALQFSNPKAIMFFVVLLPQFISTDANVPLQFLLLGGTSIAIEAVILLGYGCAAASARRLVRDERLVKFQRRVGGGCLVGIAVALAASFG